MKRSVPKWKVGRQTVEEGTSNAKKEKWKRTETTPQGDRGSAEEQAGEKSRKTLGAI